MITATNTGAINVAQSSHDPLAESAYDRDIAILRVLESELGCLQSSVGPVARELGYGNVEDCYRSEGISCIGEDNYWYAGSTLAMLILEAEGFHLDTE